MSPKPIKKPSSPINWVKNNLCWVWNTCVYFRICLAIFTPDQVSAEHQNWEYQIISIVTNIFSNLEQTLLIHA